MRKTLDSQKTLDYKSKISLHTVKMPK